jgi:hypothetical protein
VRGGALFAFGACWPHSGMQSRRSAAEGVGRNRPRHRQQRRPRLSAELGTWLSFIGLAARQPGPARADRASDTSPELPDQAAAAARKQRLRQRGRESALLLLAGNLAAKSRVAVHRFIAAWPRHLVSPGRGQRLQLSTICSTNERGEPLNHRSSEASQLIRPVLTCPALAKSKVTGSRSL